ncbi:MAG TPA: GTPase [Stellaceae bacterium]
MRLRRFTARTAADAMALVRRELGPDAVIVSTETADNGAATVTAALENDDDGDLARDFAVAAGGGLSEDTLPLDAAELIAEALTAHGTPPRLAEKILMASLELLDAANPLPAMAGALDAVFGFQPLDGRAYLSGDGGARPLMLVGPPGAGKTIAVAKLAARAVLGRRRVRVLSTDTVRAGGIEQLEAFTRLMALPLHRIDGEAQLAAVLADAAARSAGPGDPAALIDTAGINPYNASDRGELAAFIAAADAEPVLVLPAGGDLYDSVELAEAFADLGCRRMIVTRVDMVRRLGSVLAVAEAARLGFSEIGISANVADGLIPLNPVALARLLMPDVAAVAPPHDTPPHRTTSPERVLP